jgi:hypothetical protein
VAAAFITTTAAATPINSGSGWALGFEGGGFRRGFYSVFIGERLGGVSRRRTGRVGLSGAGEREAGRDLHGVGGGDVCQRLVGRTGAVGSDEKALSNRTFRLD